MSAVTLFRDKPPRGRSFALQLSDAPMLFGDTSTAMYFIHSSTWMLAARRHLGHLVTLLLARPAAPYLRIRNERVLAAPEPVQHHVLVYSLPSPLRAAARAALLADHGPWRRLSKERWLVSLDLETHQLITEEGEGWV